MVVEGKMVLRCVCVSRNVSCVAPTFNDCIVRRHKEQYLQDMMKERMNEIR